MKRTLTLPAGANFGALLNLLHTRNQQALWGQPAGSLWLECAKGVRQEDDSCRVEITIIPFAKLCEIAIFNEDTDCADWSPIEPSLLLAE